MVEMPFAWGPMASKKPGAQGLILHWKVSTAAEFLGGERGRKGVWVVESSDQEEHMLGP
jgi:hypothetical protein